MTLVGGRGDSECLWTCTSLSQTIQTNTPRKPKKMTLSWQRVQLVDNNGSKDMFHLKSTGAFQGSDPSKPTLLHKSVPWLESRP